MNTAGRIFRAFQVALEVKNTPANAGDMVSIHGSERPTEGNGNSLQYSCLGNPMDWWATVHGIAQNRTQLSN